MTQSERRLLSVTEYQALERVSRERHEYVLGHVYAMAGGSSEHARICGNIFAHCWQLARGKPCRVYQEGMQFRPNAGPSAESIYYYPDVMAVCNEPLEHCHFETAPCLLVEVLSPGTRDTDLREKLAVYIQNPALHTYLTVESEKREVTVLARNAEGIWQMPRVLEDVGEIALPCLGGSLTLKEIYEDVL